MIRTIVALLAALSIVGCQKTEQQQVQAATAAIEVKTLKCTMCVANITNALTKLEGVSKVDVDLEQKIATVEYASSTVTVASLETAIAQAGYDANTTKRDEQVYSELPRCCR